MTPLPSPIMIIHSFSRYSMLGTVLDAKDIMVIKIQMVFAPMVLISYHCTLFCQFNSFINSFIKCVLHTYFVPQIVFRAWRCTNEQSNDPCSSGTKTIFNRHDKWEILYCTLESDDCYREKKKKKKWIMWREIGKIKVVGKGAAILNKMF